MSKFTASVGRMDSGLVDTFGDEATYLPQAGMSQVITGIKIQGAEAEESPSVVPFLQFFIRLADLDQMPAKGDRMLFPNEHGADDEYTVQDVPPDEEGGVELRLQKV